ncbi:MAG: phosphatase PAP2 family protein [Psychromonas sp.]|nr:phosphatase PAP2 family protein [Psychromonas sp.]
MKYILSTMLILCSFSSHASFKESSGDFLEIAMPLAAVGVTYYHEDMQGFKELTYSLSATALTTILLKKTVEKDRPDASGDDAFPSGHAAITFSSASFLERRYGWEYGVPAYLLASWTAYTRVDANKHEVEDVLAGAAVGYLFSYLFVSEYKDLKIAPLVSNNYIGLSAYMTF